MTRGAWDNRVNGQASSDEGGSHQALGNGQSGIVGTDQAAGDGGPLFTPDGGQHSGRSCVTANHPKPTLLPLPKYHCYSCSASMIVPASSEGC